MVGNMQWVYIARVNSDQTEGRGAQVPIGYFTDKADALKAIEGEWCADVIDVEVYSSFQGWLAYAKGEAVQRARKRNNPDEFAEYQRLKEKFG